jgi:hypothetical protein
MNSRYSIKLLSASLMLIAMLAVFAGPAHAQGVVTGDTVSSGQVIEDDAILFGDNVVIDGDVNGNVIAIGNTVTLNGKVDGSLIALGQDVIVNGEISDSLYAGSLTLDFGETASVGRNVTYLGASTKIPPGASIGRHLKGIFFGAVLGGELGGDIQAVVGPVEVVRFILDQLNIEVQMPDLRRPFLTEPEVSPTPTPSSYLPIKVLAAPARPPSVERVVLAQDNPVRDFFYSRWLARHVKEFATLFIIGALLVLLLPAFVSQWSTRAKDSVALSAGYGLLITILGHLAALLLLVVVLALAAGLYALKLEALAFLTFGLGASALGVIYATFVLLTVYLSKVVVAYLVGWLLLRRWHRESRWWMLLCFVLGLLIYTLVVAIPFIGWAASVIIAAVGTGAIYLSLMPMARKTVAPEVAEAA